jgi:hypothetical protein
VNCFEELLQLFRERSVDDQGLAGLRVSEGEVGGVEEVAVELEVGCEVGDEVGGAVEGVPDDWVAEGLGVDADLVGASGFNADLNESEETVGAGDPFEDAEVGDSGTAVGAASGHAGAADDVTGDGEGDGGVVFFEVAVEKREVGLGDLALGEHLA